MNYCLANRCKYWSTELTGARYALCATATEGYIETDACDFTSAAATGLATHWVHTKATFIFEKPDIKSTVVQRLLFGSELSSCEDDGPEAHVAEEPVNASFIQLQGGGFVWAAHCSSIGASLNLSMIKVAQDNYHHAPYLWGGRSSDGCDCSGLVQMMAMAIGVSLPRDSVDQENALTFNVEYEQRQTDDLVYWPGHVGIVKTPELLLHSTAHSMRCCIELLSSIEQRAGPPSSIKRLIRDDQAIPGS